MKFTYNGKSTDDFGVTVADFNYSSTISSGLTREVLKGENSSYRLVPNHYGTKYSSVIEFTRTLIKKDQSSFSREEIEKIVKWLTSPRRPLELEVSKNYDDTGSSGIIDENEALYSSENEPVYTLEGNLFICNNNTKTIVSENIVAINETETDESMYYNGLFTDIQYEVGSGGIVGITFTFMNDSPFVREHCRQSYELRGANSEYIYTVECNSDEEEGYTYPTITMTYNSTNSLESTLKISNITDNGNTMICKLLSKNETQVNCQYQTVSSAASSATFDTLGWSEIDDLYWLRLVDGENKLKFSVANAPVNITIDYTVLKKAGELFEY